MCFFSWVFSFSFAVGIQTGPISSRRKMSQCHRVTWMFKYAHSRATPWRYSKLRWTYGCHMPSWYLRIPNWRFCVHGKHDDKIICRQTHIASAFLKYSSKNFPGTPSCELVHKLIQLYHEYINKYIYIYIYNFMYIHIYIYIYI